ncbi:MAG: peptidase C14, partial [Candidatus Chloroheliales bacterium]
MLFTQGRALVVGVGKYQYVPAANVAQTTNDAVSLAQALTNQGGYPQNQVTLLADGSASRAALIASLQQLANTAQPGDIVIFFYSGHGDYATDGSFYLTTSDTQLDGDKIKLDTGLGQSEFLTLLRAIKARQLLIIINSCFSGKLEPSLGFNTEAAPAALGSGVPDAVTTAALATGSGRVIITACQESERSWVGNGNLTIFGQSLVQGINGSAGLPGPFVSANDLYNYLFKTVPPAAQQLGHQQEPVLTVLRQVGLPLLVALNAATARSG